MGLPSKQEYHLDCDMCGGTFWSEEGFPAPQYCPACLRSQLKDAEEVIRRAWDESECCSCEAVAGSVACCECEHQTFMREYLDYHARYIQPDLPTFEDVKGILGEVE